MLFFLESFLIFCGVVFVILMMTVIALGAFLDRKMEKR